MITYQEVIAMIRICSFFSLPIEEQRIGPVYSIANSYPRNVGRVAQSDGLHRYGRVKCLVPPWDAVEAFKHGQISEAEFTARYRQHLKKNWREVKKWLVSLDPTHECYLCCLGDRALLSSHPGGQAHPPLPPGPGGAPDLNYEQRGLRPCDWDPLVLAPRKANLAVAKRGDR